MERLLELGVPPEFHPSNLENRPGFPTLTMLANQCMPLPLRMEILTLQDIVRYGCLFYCMYPNAP